MIIREDKWRLTENRMSRRILEEPLERGIYFLNLLTRLIDLRNACPAKVFSHKSFISHRLKSGTVCEGILSRGEHLNLNNGVITRTGGFKRPLPLLAFTHLGNGKVYPLCCHINTRQA